MGAGRMKDQTTESKGAQFQKVVGLHKGCRYVETEYLRVEKTLNAERNSALNKAYNPESEMDNFLRPNKKRKKTEEPHVSSPRNKKKGKRTFHTKQLDGDEFGVAVAGC